MPRDSAGNYNLVAGNPVQSGEVISSSWANNTLDDVALALTDSLDRNGRGGMLAPFRFADGTNLLPGASWVNETTTGFYRFDGGDLRVAVLTQDVMRWQTTGAQVWNDGESQWENILSDGGGGSQVPVNVGTADGQTLRWEEDDSEWQPTDILVVDDTGNVGIGPSIPSENDGTLAIGGVDAVNDNPQGSIAFSDGNGNGQSRIRGYRGGNFELGELAFEVARGAVNTYEEAMRIDSAGNVGIGTNDPKTKLEVSAEDGIDSLQFRPGFSAPGLCEIICSNTSFLYGNLTYTAASHRFGTVTGEHMRITNDGFVGINTDAPTSRLYIVKNLPSGSVANASANTLVLDNNDTGGLSILTPNNQQGRIWFGDPENSGRGQINYEHTDDSMRFGTSAGERIRIDSTGTLLVGPTANPLAGLGVAFNTTSGTRRFMDTGSAAFNQINFINSNGTVGIIQTSGTTTSYITSSDVRLKENITDAADPFAKINAIQVREFDWKAGGHQDFGFIAQELVEVAPEAVSKGETEEDTWGVDPSKLVPVLVKAIQELTARVEALEA